MVFKSVFTCTKYITAVKQYRGFQGPGFIYLFVCSDFYLALPASGNYKTSPLQFLATSKRFLLLTFTI